MWYLISAGLETFFTHYKFRVPFIAAVWQLAVWPALSCKMDPDCFAECGPT